MFNLRNFRNSGSALVAGTAVGMMAAASATAATLSAAVNVDNGYSAYISTNDGLEGTQFLAGESWPTTQFGSIALIDGVTNYLHIKAYDLGGAAGFLGTFSLTGTGFEFANGLQTLTTGEGHFTQSESGWGPYSAVTQLGAQGVFLPPWFAATQSPDAIWIWSDDNQNDNAVYFTAAVNSVSAVPLPAALPLLLAALGGLGLIRRRRKS